MLSEYMIWLMDWEDKQREYVRTKDRYLWECLISMRNYHDNFDQVLLLMESLKSKKIRRTTWIKNYQKLRKHQILCRYWDNKLMGYTKLYKKLKDNPV